VYSSHVYPRNECVNPFHVYLEDECWYSLHVKVPPEGDFEFGGTHVGVLFMSRLH